MNEWILSHACQRLHISTQSKPEKKSDEKNFLFIESYEHVKTAG